MSQENVEIVRALYDELAKGNHTSFTGFELTILNQGHTGGAEPRWSGSCSPRGSMTSTRRRTASSTLENAWSRVCGPRDAAVSGVPYDVEGAILHRFEGGRIVEMREYAEPAEALEAVGLRE